jgi:quinoprotein glucose dehydrogenase
MHLKTDTRISARVRDVERRMRRPLLPLTLVPLTLGAAVLSSPPAKLAGDWPVYGHDPGGTRFSPLTQIDRNNVSQLKIAWTYHTGDVSDGKKLPTPSAFEATPILVDGTLYLPTPFDRVIALDPETGQERWRYDPKLDVTRPYAGQLLSRGVAAWPDPSQQPGAAQRRIFLGTLDARLIALDAKTGRPCADFGEGGQVDLTRGLDTVHRGEYQVTSPPAVFADLIIVGSAIGDNQRVDETSGVVRAFDARTGRLRWHWDPIPRDPGDPAWASWKGGSASRAGAANVWSLISVDPLRGLVFLPTTSPSPDYYGGERQGANQYADSIVALRAATGQRLWQFQVVHHDLWDYDIPAQPALVTVRRHGRSVPVVAVATKMGHLFLLERETGTPIFRVVERPVPQSPVPGEALSPTQPFPTAPPPLVPEKLTPDEAWGLTPADRETARRSIEALRSEGIFTPPSLQGTLVFPGDLGGMNWSGVSFDPGRGLLVVNTNRFARAVTLIHRREYELGGDAMRKAHPDADFAPQTGTPYEMRREWLISPSLVPFNPPPWGTLAAVDLSAGKVRWQVPLGRMPELAHAPGSDQWGSLNLGGSIVTGGGLVFIGAARDDYLRAFDVETGRELWKGALPAGGQATPMTYQLRPDGRQFVVICAGGHGRLRTTLGDAVVAFALDKASSASH